MTVKFKTTVLISRAHKTLLLIDADRKDEAIRDLTKHPTRTFWQCLTQHPKPDPIPPSDEDVNRALKNGDYLRYQTQRKFLVCFLNSIAESVAPDEIEITDSEIQSFGF